MFELVKLTENCFYINSPAKIGLYTLGDEAVLIDSGNDKDAGRKIRQLLDKNGLKLRAVYNTHSHADHIGGNRYLQQNTGCRVFAPGIECCFANHPILEPVSLYGGYPHPELRHKFLLAQECDAEPLSDSVLPEGFSSIPLPGHFFDMVGYRTPDDVVFIADCLSGAETIEKYKITFLYDVGAYLDTLEKVKTMEARLFLPSHAEPTEDIRPLAELNIKNTLSVAELILDICREPSGFDCILKLIFETLGMVMTPQQHALIGSTVRSYLSWLMEKGKISAEIDGNVMVWKRI